MKVFLNSITCIANEAEDLVFANVKQHCRYGSGSITVAAKYGIVRHHTMRRVVSQ